MSDLYTKTTLQGFDQVTAISQDTINANFDYRWSSNKSKLSTFNIIAGDPDDPDSSVTAKMAAPTVSLVGADGGTQLYLSLNFTSGTFMYYTGRAKPVQHNLAFKSWVVTFMVSMDQQSIDELPQDLQNKIDLPGSYGIDQLLLDFGTAQLDNYVPDMTDTPGLDDDIAANQFKDCIQLYLAQLSKNEDNILGYALTIPDPAKDNYAVPSFPPTEVKFQIMPFYGDDGKIIAEDGRNALTFIEMTQHRNMPVQSLQWSANWLPNDSSSGTMAVAKVNFWDDYLVVQLGMYQRLILEALNEALAWLQNGGDTLPSSVPWYLSASDPNGSDDTKAAFDKANPWVFSNNKYTCTVPTIEGGSDDYDKPSFETKISNTMTWNGAGSKIITITTAASVVATTSHEGHKGNPPPDDIDTISLTPTYTLSLDNVYKGSLSFTSEVSENSFNCDCAQGGIAGWFSKDGKAHNTQMSDNYTTKIRGNVDIDTTLKNLADGLNKQQNFVFAGNGTFTYKDCAFNTEGDLIAGLYYLS